MGNMSVHTAKALIGWRMSSGSGHNYHVCLWKGVRPTSLLGCIVVNVARGGWKLAVLQLHHGATPDSAVEVTAGLRCKKVLFNQLFGNI